MVLHTKLYGIFPQKQERSSQLQYYRIGCNQTFISDTLHQDTNKIVYRTTYYYVRHNLVMVQFSLSNKSYLMVCVSSKTSKLWKLTFC